MPLNLDGEILPSRTGILPEAINIAFTSPQQRQSISFDSFLQCSYLHQLRFPILMWHKWTAEAYICLISFSWLWLPHIFSILFSYFISEIPNFSYMRFFRKRSMFCRSILLNCRFSFKAYARNVRQRTIKDSSKTTEVLLVVDGHVLT